MPAQGQQASWPAAFFFCCAPRRRSPALGGAGADGEYLGASLADAATGQVSGAARPAHRRRGAALARRACATDGFRRGRAAPEELRCGATQTDPEPRAALQTQESSTCHLVQVPVHLTPKVSSSFQPEVKANIYPAAEANALQREVGTLTEPLKEREGEAVVKLQKEVQELRLRAELGELPHDERSNRDEIELQMAKEWEAILLAFRAPRTDEVCKVEVADDPEGGQIAEAADEPIRAGDAVRVRGGKYVVLSLLGKGGQGSVYRAKAENGDLCALKAETGRCFPQAYEQLQWATGFRHPHLVRTMTYAELRIEGMLPTLLSCMELGTPITEPQRERLTPVARVGVAAAVAEAVDYLHDRRIAHTDVDLGNVLLVGGTPKLTDFGGLMRFGDDQGFVGKIETSAPEKLLAWGKDHGAPVSPAWDIFSIGILVHCIFTGGQPAGRARLFNLLHDEVRKVKNTPEFLEQCNNDPALIEEKGKEMYLLNIAKAFVQVVGMPEHHNSLHQADNEVPAEVGAVVSSCCAARPEERPSAREAAASLRHIMGDIDSTATAQRASSPGPPHRRLD
eukprot:TRINITY_DN40893_c0_g1_i1.p2 TRINITY_DN40893_c0_g1~~TRINITY_DN40893_c0_g1_i1.p2  ORF type:complete len:567 (+),score=140.09 TRINITY_DN40893_c0_g1_i1:91-1791(+)